MLSVTKRKTRWKNILWPDLYRYQTLISKITETGSICLEWEIHLEWQEGRTLAEG